MTFEFAPAKSESNQSKHGINFDQARQLWNDPKRVSFVARLADEERHGLIATWNGKLWCAISTKRDESIRIISVRRAREYEKKLYHQSQ